MIETVDDIKTIANVGTGTMGHAITLQFALAGYPVHLVGRGEASLEKAMKAIRSDAEDFAEAGLLKDGDTLDAVLARHHRLRRLCKRRGGRGLRHRIRGREP